MASELWINAFQKLKLPGNEHYPGNFENNSKTNNATRYRAEMLEYKRNRDATCKEQQSEEKAYVVDLKCSGYAYKKSAITQDSYYCKPHQRSKDSRKINTLILPVAETLGTKTSEENCKGNLPEAKALIEQTVQFSDKRNGKPEASRYCKRIPTPKEMHLLEIFKQSGKFRRTNVNQKTKIYNDFNSGKTNIYWNGKPAIEDYTDSELSDSNGISNSEDVSRSSLSALRYTQADRMASPPIILTEIWDVEKW